MQQVSDRWKETVTRSHEKKTECDLYFKDEIIAANLPVTDGEITDDSTADVRRRCTVSLPGTPDVLSLVPRTPSADVGLWPLGTELHVRTGIVYEDGSEELLPQGVFRISRPEIVEGADGLTVTVAGYDRSRAFSRARFTQPFIVNDQTDGDMVSALKRLILSRVPWLGESNIVISDSLVGFGFVPSMSFIKDDDPWKMAQKMAHAIAAEILWQMNGKLHIRTVPNFNERPADAIYEEGNQATMTELTRSLDDDRAYNGVVITIENTSRTNSSTNEDLPPIVVEAWDTDSESPTYFDPAYPHLSEYGPNPYFYSSEFIVTEEQGQDAAEAMLQNISGVIEQFTFTAITNPAHESGDVITLQNTNQDILSTVVLDSFTMGLGQTPTMSGTARRRRVTVGRPPEEASMILGPDPDL